MKQKMKKAICMAVIGALALTSAAGNNVTSQAAKKIKLSKTSVTVTAKKSKTVTIKNVKAKQVKKLTVKSSKTKIATAKKSGKTKVIVTGKKAGSAKVTVKVTLKGKKKATKLTLKVTVKKATTTTNVTPSTTPTNSPVVSGSPTPTTAATTTVNPTDAPATDAPATDAPATDEPSTTLKPTKTPKPSPGPTATPNIIPMDEYDFDIKSELWTNDWYEKEENADGSITLTRGNGDAGWQVGEFGFAIPRNKVGDLHEFTQIVIKFRDSDLTDDTPQCGYVFHMGDDTEVGWIESEDGGHPNTLSFNGTGETIITVGETKSGISESNFSTIRIFDGKIGGKITIESVRLVKGTPIEPTTPPVDTSNVDTANVDTSNVDTSSTETQKPTETEEPGSNKVDTDVALTIANSIGVGALAADTTSNANWGADLADENEDGSITFHTSAINAGGGRLFYFNPDKSDLDSSYSKIEITLSSVQADTPLVLETKKGDTAVTTLYRSTNAAGEPCKFEVPIEKAANGVMIKYNGWMDPDTRTDDEKQATRADITVSSIKFVK